MASRTTKTKEFYAEESQQQSAVAGVPSCANCPVAKQLGELARANVNLTQQGMTRAVEQSSSMTEYHIKLLDKALELARDHGIEVSKVAAFEAVQPLLEDMDPDAMKHGTIRKGMDIFERFVVELARSGGSSADVKKKAADTLASAPPMPPMPGVSS